MPLFMIPPAYIIGSTVAGAVSAYAINRLNEAALPSSNNGATKLELPNKLDKAQENEILLEAAILSMAISADGEITSEEKHQRDEVKKVYFDRIDGCEEKDRIRKKIEGLLKDRPSFREIEEIYRANEYRDERKEKLIDFVDKILRCDNKVNDAELAFKFRLCCLLESLPYDPLVRISSNIDEPASAVGFEYQTLESAYKKYPKTPQGTLVNDGFYMKHPASNQTLISVDDVLRDDFAVSKDHELIRIARDSGAKEIEIINDFSGSEITEKTGKISTGIDVRKITANGSLSVGKEDFNSLQENKNIKIKFQGHAARWPFVGWMVKFFYKNMLPKRSKWIEGDQGLYILYENCFSYNKLKSYEHALSYENIGQALCRAEIAAACDLAGIKAGKADVSGRVSGGQLVKRKSYLKVVF